jgi:hypothetical protein
MMGSLRIMLTCALWALFVQAATAQSAQSNAPEANPGRPTVSTPATLTPVGYLQFETGAMGAKHSPEFSTRYGFNEVIKLAVAPRLQFLVSAEPLDHFTNPEMTGNRVNDVSLGVQADLCRGEGARPTVSASYFHRIYDGGAPDLDFGTPVNSFLFLASAEVKGFHYDANALFNEMTNPPVRRAQFGQTLSISHRLAGRFSLSGEIWHFTQPFLRGHAVGNLWALGYTMRRTLVFDAGFNRGLTSTSTRWVTFVGFTYLLPHRLW